VFNALEEEGDPNWIDLQILDCPTIMKTVFGLNEFAKKHKIPYAYSRSTASSLRRMLLQSSPPCKERTVDITTTHETLEIGANWLQHVDCNQKMYIARRGDRLFWVDSQEQTGVELRFFAVADLQPARIFGCSSTNDTDTIAKLSEEIPIRGKILPVLRDAQV
jgi:hypothetical protein